MLKKWYNVLKLHFQTRESVRNDITALGKIANESIVENQALREALKMMYSKNNSYKTMILALLLQSGVDEIKITEEILDIVDDQDLEMQLDNGDVILSSVPLEDETEACEGSSN